MMIVSGLFLFSAITSCFCEEYLFTSANPNVIDQAVTPLQLFVVVDESTGDAKVTCSVVMIPFFGTPVQTYWQLVETSEFLTFDDNGIAVNYASISVSGDNDEMLTISNFQVEMNMLQIACRGSQSSSESVLITFGFKVGPLSSLQASVYDVVEFTSFTLDLKVNKTFPPNIQYTTFWMYDGQIIFNTPGIETGSYDITIDSVTRSYSGKLFELSVPDTMESVNFTLNVLYPPQADLSDASTIVYSSVGDEAILFGATDITGNPIPAGIWSIYGSSMPIVLSGRYSSETIGELSITNVAVEDFGEYVFTVSNGVGDDITSDTISLLEIEPRFSTATVSSANGNISITWTLAHIGYELDPNQVSVSIECESDDIQDLVYLCQSNCIEDSSDLRGYGFIGPVLAGKEYHCILTASTVNGSNMYTIDSFIPTSGIPYTPELSVVVDGGSITISVHYRYPGDVESLFFTLIITNDDNVVVQSMSYSGEQSATLTVTLSAGMYSVEVSGQNKYGSHEISSIEFQEEPTTPLPTENAESLKPFGLSLLTLSVLLTSFVSFSCCKPDVYL